MSINPLTRLAALLLVLMLAACGGGGSSSGGSNTPQPEPEPEPEPLTAPTLSWEARQTKLFHFSWPAAGNVDEYSLLENVDGASGYEPIATIEGDASEYDMSVFLPEKINASYILEACNADGCVESESIAVSGSLAEAVGYFKASNAEGGAIDDSSDQGDRFGYSISLSADGSTMAVGARFEDSSARGVGGEQSDNGTRNSGAVYIFQKNGGIWQQQAYLKSSNSDAGDQFGSSISLSADGNILAVGAIGEDSTAAGVGGDQDINSSSLSEPGRGSGAVYMFTREGQTWTQQAYIKSSNPGLLTYFGWSTSLSEDGSILAVGEYLEGSAATGIDGDYEKSDARNSGAVYLFEKTDNGWQKQAYIKASNTGSYDQFGEFLTLSNDGNTLAVSAVGEESLSGGIDGDQDDNSAPSQDLLNGAGAVYIFVRGEEGWMQQSYIKASHPEDEDGFGAGLDLSADGNVLVVGADGEDGGIPDVNDTGDNSLNNTGAAYVFERRDSSWEQSAYLKAPNLDEGDTFGRAVAISDDGKVVAVTAPGEDSSVSGIDGDQNNNDLKDAGAVYLFAREADTWLQTSYIKSSNPSEEQSFGLGVTLSGDGKTLAVATDQETSTATGINGDQNAESATEVGAVYLY